MVSPIAGNDMEKDSFVQNLKQQTCDFKSENTENACIEARSSGPEDFEVENGSISTEHDEGVLPNSEQVDVNNEVALTSNDVEKDSLGQNLEQQACDFKSENTENGSVEGKSSGPAGVVENISILTDHDEDILLKSEQVDVKNKLADSPGKVSACKRKKVPSKIKSIRYPLRSVLGGNRVLRSMFNTTKSKAQPHPVNIPFNPVTRGRKRRRKVKIASNDEFSLIRKRVRYLLTRMSYEQNLIDAYSGEGWKGQSAEKIRPEKELQRAKSEILRCKFRIRELFRLLDSQSLEGRFEESLFDSEGQIDSEDIFCAKCGLKDFSTNNDIILCDGICDRGFHQKCLNPPLLSEDVPLDDEGWLCPACDCKVDCIELLNESQGNDISIEDTWEKVFPEVTATADGDEQHDDLPSDDSEDYDYNPNGPAGVEDHNEKSDSDVSNSNKHNENFGFPSDDSEDDEYDPNAVDTYKSKPNNGSSSDESDFTSDSDEFCAELCKASAAVEDSASSLQNQKPFSHSDEGRLAGDVNNSELLSQSEPDSNLDNVLVSGRRQLERLDYKKLYDETYGKSSSDSSADEDWSESVGNRMPSRGKKHANAKESRARPITNHKKSKNAVDTSTKVDMVRKSDIGDSQVSQAVHETTPRKAHPPFKSRAHKHEVAGGCQEPDHNGTESSASVHKRLGEIATQKLCQSFQENQYPSRQEKESLAQELGLTFKQVRKWFENARHSSRSAKKVAHNGVCSPNKNGLHTDGKTTGGGKGIKGVKRTTCKGGSERVKEGEGIGELDVEREKAISPELKKMKKK